MLAEKLVYVIEASTLVHKKKKKYKLIEETPTKDKKIHHYVNLIFDFLKD